MEKNTKAQFLGSHPILSSLNQQELEHLVSIAQVRRAPRYQFIFMPDESADHLCFLVSGKVKTGTFSPEGREVIKEILSSGAMFGDMTLGGETARTEFAQALHDEAVYLTVKVSDFQSIMQSNQRLVFACMKHLSQRLQRVVPSTD